MIAFEKVDLGRMQSRDFLQKFGFKIARLGNVGKNGKISNLHRSFALTGLRIFIPHYCLSPLHVGMDRAEEIALKPEKHEQRQELRS